MDIDRLRAILRGKFNADDPEKLRDRLNSAEGRKFLEDLFDEFEPDEISAEDENLKSRLLSKIHNKIRIEELIADISKEHKKHEKILDKSRKPVARKFFKKRNTIAFVAICLLLIVSAIGIINYSSITIGDKAVVEKPACIEKSTGKGQKLTLHLPDGSKAILNSRSSISYPETFSDSVREVYVKGEIFFDVKHKQNKPFIVHSGDLISRVLGTSFNVRYRPEDNINVVALVTGKVRVSLNASTDSTESYVLTPGELMQLNTLSGIFKKEKFDISREIAWKDNIIYFTDANFDEVFKTLENWYGVDIKFANVPKKTWKLSAKFENENLENILNALSLSQGIDYELHDKTVKVKF